MKVWRTVAAAILLVWLVPLCGSAENTAPFDLAGPKIDVRVTRAGKELPISAVPTLQPGDRIWVHPDLPATQSAHYLLVAAFLRGATNPPPEKWFIKAETWTKQIREEGFFLTVPPDAQQTLLFLAPETGGDFKTLRNAVQGRPGAFVRASQDLNAASLDRARVQTYLGEVRKASNADPKSLHDTTLLLTRSLNLKLNQDCFNKPADEQEQCLTQNSDQLVLTDGHGPSVVSTLTTGAGSDLVSQLSATPTAGGGYYSAYVGAIVDVAKLLEGLHTAEYQYIPALSFPQADTLNLKLNNPPSFHNPKSVIVVALPAVEAAPMPVLRAVDPKEVVCLGGPEAVLPVDGSPLLYSTGYAHGMQLHVTGAGGASVTLPAAAVAARGGFVVAPDALHSAKLGAQAKGTLEGMWGFSRLAGPEFSLELPHAVSWSVPPSGATALVVGRDDELRLKGDAAACVSGVTIRNTSGAETPASFAVAKDGNLTVTVPLKDAQPGELTLRVAQKGLPSPDAVTLHSYAEAGHLDALSYHAGDSYCVLTGTRLDEVAALKVNGESFKAGQLTREGDRDKLRLTLAGGAALPKWKPGDAITAQVSLTDGRTIQLGSTVAQPRPQVNLMSKAAVPPPAPAADSSIPVKLSDPNELPLGDRITFTLKSLEPATFTRTERIEISSVDGSLHTAIDLNDGLTLQDASVMLGVFDPLKSFGASAFGPLQLRPVDATGEKGDWLPLGVLVRVPSIASLHCPRGKDVEPAAEASGAASSDPGAQRQPDGECTLAGSNLFLLDSVAADPLFKQSVSVPDGFTEQTLAVPRPQSGGQLYVKLRDDPAVVNSLSVPALPTASRLPGIRKNSEESRSRAAPALAIRGRERGSFISGK